MGMMSRKKEREAAATGLIPLERAIKTGAVTILMVYQHNILMYNL